MCILCSDKYADRRIKQKTSQRDSQQKIWRDSVTDKALEEKIYSELLNTWVIEILYMKHGISQGESELYLEIINVLRSLPSWSEENNVLLWELETKRYLKNNNIAMKILLARHGKLTEYDTQFSTSSLPPQYNSDTKIIRKQYKELMLWIEGELKSHGSDVCLYTTYIVDGNKRIEVPATKCPGYNLLEDKITDLNWRSIKHECAGGLVGGAKLIRS